MAELKNNQPFQFDSQQEEIHQTPDSFKEIGRAHV